MNREKILIVEDDADINRLLGKILKKEGYDTLQAYSGTEAWLYLKMENPDLLLLDLMLPGMCGEELVRRIRKDLDLDMPVLVLSARAGLEDKVGLLKEGADDYLTKPFEPEEVLARVYAALRRYAGRHSKKEGMREDCLSYKQMKLYPDARRVTAKEQELSLTGHEFDILHLLLREPKKVYSRETLYEQVWQGGYYGEDNTVNVHVSNLRKKIAAADPGEEYIRTVWGIGFKMA